MRCWKRKGCWRRELAPVGWASRVLRARNRAQQCTRCPRRTTLRARTVRRREVVQRGQKIASKAERVEGKSQAIFLPTLPFDDPSQLADDAIAEQQDAEHERRP